MRKAAVIGKPVSHSLSPAIFSFLAKRLGVTDLDYTSIEVSPAQLAKFLKGINPKTQYVGLNVTIPHKEVIAAELGSLSPEAKAVGAVNVVEVRPGSLRGHNTDIHGILQCLVEHDFQTKGADVLIFGAGGAARACAYALGKSFAYRVSIVARNDTKAQALVQEMQTLFQATEFEVVKNLSGMETDGLDLVVNATPVGMASNKDNSLDFKKHLSSLSFADDAAAFDMIYNPEKTLFLEAALSEGLRAINGLEMLVNQALGTWEIWFGPILGTPEFVAEIRTDLIQHLRTLLLKSSKKSTVNNSASGSDKPIFLAGFMGVGKTTVAAQLAKSLGWTWIDIDQHIEKDTGSSVGELFSEKGEAAFRELEKQTVLDFANAKQSVVSLGGGALMNADTLKTLLKSGYVVFLDASAETLEARLGNTAAKRPLLAGLKTKAERLKKIRELLEKRKATYKKAHLHVKTDGRTLKQVSDDILSELAQLRSTHANA